MRNRPTTFRTHSLQSHARFSSRPLAPHRCYPRVYPVIAAFALRRRLRHNSSLSKPAVCAWPPAPLLKYLRLLCMHTAGTRWISLKRTFSNRLFTSPLADCVRITVNKCAAVRKCVQKLKLENGKIDYCEHHVYSVQHL